MTSPSERGARGDEVLRRLALTRYADTLERLPAPAPLDRAPFPYGSHEITAERSLSGANNALASEPSAS